MSRPLMRCFCSCMRTVPNVRYYNTIKELPLGLTSFLSAATKSSPSTARPSGSRPMPLRLPVNTNGFDKDPRANIQLSRPRRDEEIKARIITFVDEEGNLHKNVRMDKALKRFDRQRYFLIEVDSSAEQPVCRLFDKKQLYEKQKASRKKRPSPESVTKEIVFGWNVSLHDMDHKLVRARHFLEKGNKVKIDIVKKKGQVTLEKNAQNQVIQQVTEQLKPFSMTKKPAFVPGGSCALMFASRP